MEPRSGAAGAAGVDKDRMVLGDRLGDGGQGTVYAVPRLRINREWEVAYKEYRRPALAALDADVLDGLVALLPSLDFESGRWLGEHTAWPAAVVRENGRTVGFLMRTAPDAFRREMAFDPGVRRVAGLEFLLNSPAYVKRALGTDPSPRQRVRLLANLARLLAELHDLDIAVGDLSPKNVLFALEPSPRCFLMDCDSVRFRGRSALPQVQTPGWSLPQGEPPATAAGDVFKFALLAVRLLAGDQDTRKADALEAVDPRLGRLAERSLRAEDPAARPTAREWQRCLEEATGRTRTGTKTGTGTGTGTGTASAARKGAGAAGGTTAKGKDQKSAASAPPPASAPSPARATSGTTGYLGCVLVMALLVTGVLVGIVLLAR
ncbi:hypothetical protein ABT160_35805 [Streptomyces sp. NPDC001941]|uniref:hypothetical protein n=1 Tax=Streptomyces sp. NPDC001941 TaxID=3154659 RepID=UPI003329797E